MKILGEQHGVEFRDRGDGHILLVLLSEDDTVWHEQSEFSSFWLDDLMQVLRKVKKELQKYPNDPDGFGKCFPDAASLREGE